MKTILNIFKYRELLKNNVKKEIRGRYKNSVLGVLWTFLNPLLQLAVYAIIFPLILKDTKEAYVVFVCVGLIPWTFFTTSVAQSAYTIIGNANIVKKVYFPREILPLSVVVSGAVNFCISVLIIIGFCFIYGKGLTWAVLFFPLVLLIQFALQLGIAFILAAITVYFRDMEHFVQIGLMLMFYATPIVYDSRTIPAAFSFIMKINPMAVIIEGYRDIFYNQTMPNMIQLGAWGAISVALVFGGWFIFNKLQRGFAEEL
ncbi:MAG: ABC transporter permease [Clostridiales bacterium]|nr:ABC transporter permease [Clostridiales bacterium]